MSYTIINCQQNTEEWLAARRGKLTASVAKKIITPTGKLSASAKGLMIDLATEMVVDDPTLKQRQDKLSFNDAIAWGNLHEPDARKCFTEKTGFAVDQVGFLQSTAHTCLGLSPDGMFQDGETPCGLEIKCPISTTHAEWHYDEKLPDDHKTQVHFSMAITGIKTWYFMSYYPGLKPFILPVHYDDFTEKVRQAAIEFAEKYAIEAPKIWKKILP
jgi:putative phage-type endonuclease